MSSPTAFTGATVRARSPADFWQDIASRYPDGSAQKPPAGAPATAPIQPTPENPGKALASTSPVVPPRVPLGTTVVNVAARHVLDKARPLDFADFPNPPQGERQRPASTIPNIGHLLTKYGITVRYDVIKKKQTVTMPGHFGSADNFDNVAITQIQSLATLNGMKLGQVPGCVEAIGDRNLLNPVADWMLAKPWDGVDRLPAFYNTLTEREGFPPELKETLMYRWMLGAVAAALMPKGFACRGVLVLQGPQAIGKTKWTNALVSDAALANQVIRLGHHLDAGDKDSQLAAVTHWIVEIGELDGSFKKDVARLKGFLTADSDKIRRPYGRLESHYARKTVFCATVNDPQFLVDPTGNSRWWTIPVVAIDYAHTIDMQQLFAQLAGEYERDPRWWLTPEEERRLESQNRMYRTESVIRERILGAFDLDRIAEPGLPAMTSTEVLKRVGYDQPTNTQLKECVAVLRELLGDSKRMRGQEKWRAPFAHPDDSNFVDIAVRSTTLRANADLMDWTNDEPT